jgi:hypothetical protein
MELETIISEPNKYSVNELNAIRTSIENMNKYNQIEILRILHNNDKCVINENKYGIHVNLSDVETVTIDELLTYIKYVNTQESTLHTFEQQKEDFKNIYFMKDNKDNS